MKILDISLPLSESLPRWPGDPVFQLRQVMRLENGDGCELSEFRMCAHFGTHLDAPAHYFSDGADTASIPLETLVGPADVLFFPEAPLITAALLETVRTRLHADRLLFKTRNSTFWSTDSQLFREDFCALSEDAARWIVEQNIRLVGIDYLSIEPYASSDGAVHKLLLANDVVILEGLNLAHVSPGSYQLACLPLALQEVEGAPCRAVLFEAK